MSNATRIHKFPDGRVLAVYMFGEKDPAGWCRALARVSSSDGVASGRAFTVCERDKESVDRFFRKAFGFAEWNEGIAK